jgi:hypothetical protein
LNGAGRAAISPIILLQACASKYRARGCASETRIYDAGPYRIRDHRFWLPLLALFSGARLGELCQLSVDDVREIEGVWCLEITPGGSPAFCATRLARVPQLSHTIKDALRAAGVEERIQDALLGHENDHVSGAYGEGYKPPRLLAELSKVQYSGLDLSALYDASGP